jgi:Nucleotide-diphospho-sugar transferase
MSHSSSSAPSSRKRYPHSNNHCLNQPSAISSLHVRLFLTHLVAAICAWQSGVFYSQHVDRCSSYHHHQQRLHSNYNDENETTGAFSLSWGLSRWAPSLPLPRRRTSTSSSLWSGNGNGNYHVLRRTLGRVRVAPASAIVTSFISFPQVPSTLTKLYTGFTTVNYHDFIQNFRLGSPLQGPSNPKSLDPSAGSSQVLLFYQTPSGQADQQQPQQLQLQFTANGLIDGNAKTRSFADTTRTCKEVKHIVANIFTKFGDTRDRNANTCTAIVGKSESYHIQKWIQTSSKESVVPLVPTNRYQFVDKYKTFNGYLRDTPSKTRQGTALRVVNTFHSILEEALQDLQPIADRVAARKGGDGANKHLLQGIMVIMVCNYGHSELFVNSVCAARANGVDLSKILMFATDIETHQLAESLGVTSFYNKKLFEFIPTRAAQIYGDDRYAQVMLSKSFVTHLAVETGYDFIFQDVDITPYSPDVWNWWAAKKTDEENYDLYFQEDFNSRAEYSPWYV